MSSRFRLKQCVQRLRAAQPTLQPPRISFPHERWILQLHDHPNNEFREYILNGNRFGYAIGIGKGIKLSRNRHNLPTNLMQKIAVTNWILTGIAKGFIWGPFSDYNKLPSIVQGLHGCVTNWDS